MLTLVLAIGHHLLIFSLIVILAMEYALIKTGLRGEALLRVAALDAMYGVAAVLVVAVGIGRVLYEPKGASFYLENPWFWGKVVAFVLIGLISIAPTVFLLKWRRATQADSTFVPSADKVERVRGYVAMELGLLVVVLVCAAAMARRGSF
jgi:putative membrane protein